MRQVTVWFNKSGASNYAVIENIAQAAQPNEKFRFVCTHTQPDFSVQAVSDVFEVEPVGLVDYVGWCLDFVRRHSIDVFFPDKGVNEIAGRRAEFEALGCKLMIPASADQLEPLAHKDRQYRLIGEGVVPIPDYRVATDLASFDAAYGELKQRHARVCFKPCESIFGRGFRAISEEGSAVQRLFNGSSVGIGLEEARAIFGETPAFRDLMVMEYLPGLEHSVDCLAQGGKLVRAISRIKVSDRVQRIEDNPVGIALAARLAERLSLDGLFNAQFRDSERSLEPFLLEINARMSGGLYVTFQSGVSLPYWAIRLALGTAQPADVPEPETGVTVAQLHRAVRLPLAVQGEPSQS